MTGRCTCGDGSAEEDRGAVLACPVHGIGVPVSERTRESIRRAAADLRAASERRAAVTRPDGIDGGGHPGIEAANLEGYLGRFSVPLLDALEANEAEIERLMALAQQALDALDAEKEPDDGIGYDKAVTALLAMFGKRQRPITGKAVPLDQIPPNA